MDGFPLLPQESRENAANGAADRMNSIICVAGWSAPTDALLRRQLMNRGSTRLEKLLALAAIA